MSMQIVTTAQTYSRPNRRDFSIDLLRTLAILEVVLAHSGLPQWLFQTRNFGLPLLMLLSGWSIRLATRHESPAFFGYAKHRFTRLVAPTWLFIALYFSGFYVLDAVGLTARHYSYQHVLSGFSFGTDMDYVWVIKVNILISLVTPLLIHAVRRTNRDVFLACCFSVAICCNLLWVGFNARAVHALLGPMHEVVKTTVFYMLGYGTIFAIGLTLPGLSSSAMMRLALACGVVFGVVATILVLRTGHFVPTQLYKYPPQVYYLSYALFVSLVLIASRHHLARCVTNARTRAIIGFIGGNTLWIYLWHIAVIDLVQGLIASGLWPDHYLAAWIGITVGAASLTWLQGHVMRAVKTGWSVVMTTYARRPGMVDTIPEPDPAR